MREKPIQQIQSKYQNYTTEKEKSIQKLNHLINGKSFNSRRRIQRRKKRYQKAKTTTHDKILSHR
jgi:hypothetical protein